MGRHPRLVLAALAAAVAVQLAAALDANLGLVDVLGRSMPSLRDALTGPPRPAAGYVLLRRADASLPDAPVLLVDITPSPGSLYAVAFAYELYPRRRLYGPPAVWPDGLAAYARARGARFVLVRRPRTPVPWRVPARPAAAALDAVLHARGGRRPVTTVVQLAAVAVLAAIGWPLVGALASGARGPVERVSLAIWLGYAPLTVVLFLVGLVVPYGRATACGAAVLALAGTLLARRRLGATSAAPASADAAVLVSARADRAIGRAAGAATLLVLAQPVALAVRGLPPAYDFYAIWGFDAKVFFVRSAPGFVAGFQHAYYPAAAPFHHLFLDLLAGRVGTGLQLLPSALEFGALVGVTRYLARRGGAPPALAAVTGLLLVAGTSAAIFTALSGYGDLPVAAGLALATGGAAAWLRGDERALLLSAAGAGLAAWSKFEGLPSALVVLVALLLGGRALGRRHLLRAAVGWLAIVAATVAPWWLFVAAEGAGGGTEHVSRLYLDPGFILGHVGRVLLRPGDFALWWPLALGLVALTAPAWWRAGAAARTLVLLVLAELVTVLGAYVVTSHAGSVQDVEATAPRLYVHWMPGVALAVACGVASALRPRRDRGSRTL